MKGRKNKKIKSIELLRLFLGIVFLTAAIYRIFNFSMAVKEVQWLGMSSISAYFVILLEIIVGLSLLANKMVKISCIAASIFLTSAIIIALIKNWTFIMQNIGELFIFNADPTDIFLHVVYLAMLIYLVKNYRI